MLFAFLFCSFVVVFLLRFSRCCYLNGSLFIYMFRLTLKDFPSIIGSINTCLPNFSLSLSLSLLLYTLLLFERFALLLPLLTYCVSDSVLHLLFLLPLFVITVLVSVVFLCIYISTQYCHLNTSLFIVYLNHIFIIIINFNIFSLASGFD